MGLGDVFTLEEQGSPAKFNAKTTIWADATTLGALATTPCMRVVPTTTGGIFVKDVALRRNADNNAWIVDGLSIHRHQDETNAQGGSFERILMETMGKVIDYNFMGSNTAGYNTIFSGANADVTDTTNETGSNYTRLRAGTDLNGFAQIYNYGVIPDFGKIAKFQIGMEISLNTSMLFRAGIGAEQVSVANNNLKKFGFEGCSAAPEGTVMLAFTADNVTRSTQASTNPIVSVSDDSYVCQHTPGLNMKFVKGDLETVTTKTGNIPSSGSIGGISGDRSGILKIGIKTTTAGQQKEMRVWASRFVGITGTGRWTPVAWLE